jgi:acetyl esterase/lipase
MQTLRFGPTSDQEGDLHLPRSARPPVVCLLHGGFWKMPYGRDQFTAVAEDLAARGYAAWNLEYRRLGTPGAGWPGTMEDVAVGVDFLAELESRGISLDLARVAVVGHSAGGQLALWAAGRRGGRVNVAAALALAPVADLARAYEERVGGLVVADLLGGPPAERPEALRAASPLARLPLGVPQVVLHGALDDVVPVAHSRDYVRAACQAGDAAVFEELPGTGHMEFLDPAGTAHRRVVHWLGQLPGTGRGRGRGGV